MISKGTTHNNGARLAVYMTTGKAGERAELWELRGFAATNIKDAFRDVQIMSGATQCEQPFMHVQVRNRDGETLTRAQWEHAADRIERMLGLTGQPRAIAFHVDLESGHEHMHVAFSRIDQETMTAKPLPYFKLRLKAISRELEFEFALEPVTNHRPDRIKFAPTRAEEEQARRLGLDIHEIRNTIRKCWDRSDNGSSFQAALEHEDVVLARGEKRDFVVIDREGGLHALGKRILDVSAAGVRARLGDIFREDLPTVAMARTIQVERQIDREKGVSKEQEPVHWDRDRDDAAWQQAVMDAGIAKEKIEGRFAEPSEKRQQEKENGVRAEKELDDRRAAIRLAYTLSDTPEAFRRHLREAGFTLARTMKEEADISYRNAAYAREIGRYAPEFREGEIVAVDQKGHVLALNRGTTGESRANVAAFLGTLDTTRLNGIQQTQEDLSSQMHEAKKPKAFEEKVFANERNFGKAGREMGQRIEAPPELGANATEIWNSYQRSTNIRHFVKALDERDLTLAVVTEHDVVSNNIQQHYNTDKSRLLPKELREGEFVVVASDGHVYNLNKRTTGEASERVQKALAKTLDRKSYGSVMDTLKQIEERGAERELGRQAFRDVSRGSLKKEPDGRPTGPLGRPQHKWKPFSERAAESINNKTGRTIGKAFDGASDAFQSLFAPILTPEQKWDVRHANATREIERDAAVDFSQFTEAQARQREQEDQEIRRARERQGRER